MSTQEHRYEDQSHLEGRVHHGGSAATFASCLKGIDLPATKTDILRIAKMNGASQEILDIAEAMPEPKFRTMVEVMKAFGEVT